MTKPRLYVNVIYVAPDGERNAALPIPKLLETKSREVQSKTDKNVERERQV